MIKKIYYEEIPDDMMSLEQGGAYYFHLNTAKLNDNLMTDYMSYEENQLLVKNKMLGVALKRGDIKHINPNKTVISLSPQKNKTVLIAEL